MGSAIKRDSIASARGKTTAMCAATSEADDRASTCLRIDGAGVVKCDIDGAGSG